MTKAKEASLWRYNRITGHWNRVRDVTPSTSEQWLAVWQEDEPNESFKVSDNKPNKPPKEGK
jgi:hypothetical protein